MYACSLTKLHDSVKSPHGFASTLLSPRRDPCSRQRVQVPSDHGVGDDLSINDLLNPTVSRHEIDAVELNLEQGARSTTSARRHRTMTLQTSIHTSSSGGNVASQRSATNTMSGTLPFKGTRPAIDPGHHHASTDFQCNLVFIS